MNLVGARAARLVAVLLLVQNGVEGLNEGRAQGLAGGSSASIVGLYNGNLSGGGVASAASSSGSLVVSVALGLLALQFALGAGAVGGLHALLAAVQLFADRGALGLGSHAGGVAASRLAHGLALVAGVQLASVLGASNGANRSFAMNSALGAGNLLAFHFALRASAHRMADSRALRVVTHPLASRMARTGSRQGHSIDILGTNGHNNCQKSEDD